MSSPGGPTCTSSLRRIPGRCSRPCAASTACVQAQGSVQGFALVAKLKKNGQPGEPVQPSGPPTLGVTWGADRELSQAFGGDGRAEVGHRAARTRPGRARRGHRGGRGHHQGRGAALRGLGRLRGPRAPTSTSSSTSRSTSTWSGSSSSAAPGTSPGATLAAFDIPTAQEMMNRVGQFDVIRIAGDEGVAQTQLQRSVREAVHGFDDPRLEVLTGEQLAQDTSDEIRDNLSFFNTFLLVFTIIALFVGAFIIYNTFSIIVAQRAPRARPAPRARRIGRTGHRLGRDRGVRRRPAVVDPRTGAGHPGGDRTPGADAGDRVRTPIGLAGDRAPHDHHLARRRYGHHVRLRDRARPTGRTRRPDGRAPHRHGAPELGASPIRHWRRARVARDRLRRPRLRRCRRVVPRRCRGCRRHRRRDGLRRRGDAEPPHRRADGSLPRLGARQGARHVGRARPRERRPEPAAHRVHGCRADDRHRDRRGGGDLRVIDQDDVERRARERREGGVLAGIDGWRVRARPARGRGGDPRRLGARPAPPSPSSASGSSSSTETRRR